MKKLIITLLCLVAISYLIAQENTFWFFPTTSVMIATPGEHSTLVNSGISSLRQKYTEDELITLISPNPDSDMFRISFNGKTILTQPHPQIAQGQPVLGEMHYGQYKKAYLYIKNPTYNGSVISFTLMFAEQETFEDLMIYFIVVEKATNLLVYTGGQGSVSTAGDYSHTVASGSYPSETYKAVILIGDGTYMIPEADPVILQAASTERVIPPFRVVTDTPLAEILPSDYPIATMPLCHLQSFYLVNTDFTTTAPIPTHISMSNIYNPEGFTYSFCSSSDGTCHQYEADINITPQTSENEYEPQIEWYTGQRGSLVINMNISVASHSVSIPFYFVMPTVTEALVIQDLAGAHDDQNILAALQEGFMIGSFALYDTALGRLDEEMLSNFDYIIWNQSGIYPNLTYDILEELGRHVTDRGGSLWVIGQNVAKSLGDYTYSPYAKPSTISFLQNILRADIATPANTSLQLSSTENGLFTSPLNFTLASEGQNAHISTTALTPRSPNLAQIVDSLQNVKAVGNNFGGREIALFDFDFASIPVEDAANIMFDTTVWLTIDQDASGIPAPITSLSLYPNPVSNTLHISYKSVNTPKINPEYTIYNIKGQKITSGNLSPRNASFTKEVSLSNLNLSSGVYFVRVKDQNYTKTSKIMILK